MKRFAILALATLSLGEPAIGQATADAAPAATATPAAAMVEDLAWLAGHWRGEGLGGTCEEFWTEPMDGQMHGLFRLFRNGKLVFTEHLALVREAEAGVVMKVKHFTPEFVGWEDKEGAVRFVLEEARPGNARFKGLAIQRDGDRLDISIRLRNAEGVREHPIKLERVKS